MDCCSLEAIVFLIEVAGISSYVGPAAAAAGAPPAAGVDFSISSKVMRPPGPVPLIDFNETPLSKAAFLAAGLILGSLSRDV